MQRLWFVALLPALSLLIALGARAQPAPDSAQALKAAALARVAQLAPDVPVVQSEIVRVVRDWAVVRVYPPPGVTDPALVFVRREDGIWIGVGGPGTAFPPGSVPGAPESLLNSTTPYTGKLGQLALARLTATATYRGPGFSFEYPAGASVGGDSPSLQTAKIAGPQQTGIFNGPAYEITVIAARVTPSMPLDEWGYDEMQREIARRLPMDGPDAAIYPLSATYFTTGANAVFQIDWFGGDSTIRWFYVAPQGGGPALVVMTRVYPVENNPAAPQAEAAVTLLLQTLVPAPQP